MGRKSTSWRPPVTQTITNVCALDGLGNQGARVSATAPPPGTRSSASEGKNLLLQTPNSHKYHCGYYPGQNGWRGGGRR